MTPNMKEKTLTRLKALGFSGFYQGFWDQGENEYNELQMRKYDEDDFNLLNFLDDWGFGPDYRDKITKEYAERYVDLVNEVLHTDFMLTESSLSSPREYNFTTDEIFCEVEIEDFDSVITNLIYKMTSNGEILNAVKESIKQNHTSCDGFWSFMSNDIEDWMWLVRDPDNNYLSYFIGYLVNAINPGCLHDLNEHIYCRVSESTDWHCVMPETVEAKEEYDLYTEHGEVYIDFLKEYRLSHVNPNRRDWPDSNVNKYDMDWEDFKEAFAEHVKHIEEYRKHKAWLDAQPKIPGLE